MASYSLSKVSGPDSAVWTHHPPTLRSNRGIRGRMSKLPRKKPAIKWIVCYQWYNLLYKAFWVTADWLFGNKLTRSDNNFRSSLTICLFSTKCEHIKSAEIGILGVPVVAGKIGCCTTSNYSDQNCALRLGSFHADSGNPGVTNNSIWTNDKVK